MTKVELYTWTYCPFCIRAKALLEEKNISYREVIIDGDNEKKRELYENTGQNTVPFIFINGNFLGGYTELNTLEEQGELEKMIR
jgi:glutaredoxin 3